MDAALKLRQPVVNVRQLYDAFKKVGIIKADLSVVPFKYVLVFVLNDSNETCSCLLNRKWNDEKKQVVLDQLAYRAGIEGSPPDIVVPSKSSSTSVFKLCSTHSNLHCAYPVERALEEVTNLVLSDSKVCRSVNFLVAWKVYSMWCVFLFI